MKCPVCLNIDPGTSCRHIPEVTFECDVCGNYTTDQELALQARSGACNTGYWELTKVQRTVLSHRIRLRSDTGMVGRRQQLASASEEPRKRQALSGGRWLHVTKEMLERLRSEARSPTPAEQAENAIRFIGDHVSTEDESLGYIPDQFRAAIGASDYGSGLWVVEQLQAKGLVDFAGTMHRTRVRFDDGVSEIQKTLAAVTLSLDGWQEYEQANRGSFEGNYGFVALQFNDPELDELLATTKATVLKETGYDLIDMRDVEQAGIIDNIMRLKIADAAFVLADLTHGNPGAYWEAGYAEGLDKPVVYICREDVFDRGKTHFDTNHCTTIPWSSDDPSQFCHRLIATLRRSLGD